MTVDELAEGYAWCYRRLFSHASIWRRRPADWRAVAPYLAMSYLYKRSNRIWHQLIRHRLTARAWRVLVEATRRRHLRFRRRLADQLGPDFYLSSPLDANCSRDAARLVIGLQQLVVDPWRNRLGIDVVVADFVPRAIEYFKAGHACVPTC